MDADARAREVMGNLCGDAASWCFNRSELCSCRSAIAAALREVERETVERCAKLIEQFILPAPIGDGDVANLVVGYSNGTMQRLAAAIRALDERRAAD